MKSSTSQYLYSVFRQVSQEFRQIGQKVGIRLLRTPLPKILIICIALALFITIIPLVITLFIVFVLIRFLLGVITMGTGQNRSKPAQNQYIERIDK